MKDIVLSIVIPIYNIQSYLNQCLDSVANQDLNKVEVILVDDGSTDECSRICDEYEKKIPDCRCIHKQNGGLISARRIGVQHSKGTYIGFLDGDDYVEKELYSKIVSIIDNFKPDIISTGFTSFDNTRTNVFEKYAEEQEGFFGLNELNEIKDGMIMSSALQRGIMPSIWSKYIKKELLLPILEKVDERITDGEDAAVVYPCIYRAESIYFLKDSYQYQYRINMDSMSHKYNPDWVKNADRYLIWEKQFFCQYNDSSIDRQVIYDAIYMFYRYYLREIYRCIDTGDCVRRRFEFIFEESLLGSTFASFDIDELSISKADKFLLKLVQKKFFIPFRVKRVKF